MVAQPIRVEAFASLPHDVGELLEVGLGEGHVLVERLVTDWKDGSNRFDQMGEHVVAARIGLRLVGVEGLNRDPYTVIRRWVESDPCMFPPRHGGWGSAGSW